MDRVGEEAVVVEVQILEGASPDLQVGGGHPEVHNREGHMQDIYVLHTSQDNLGKKLTGADLKSNNWKSTYLHSGVAVEVEVDGGLGILEVDGVLEIREEEEENGRDVPGVPVEVVQIHYLAGSVGLYRECLQQYCVVWLQSLINLVVQG